MPKYGAFGRFIWLLSGDPKGITSLVQGVRKRLPILWKYAKVELRPPKPSEVSEGVKQLMVDARSMRKPTEVTPREALMFAVTVADTWICFSLGEILGRRNLIGYNVPGGVSYGLQFAFISDMEKIYPEAAKKYKNKS